MVPNMCTYEQYVLLQFKVVSYQANFTPEGLGPCQEVQENVPHGYKDQGEEEKHEVDDELYWIPP